MEFCPRCGSVLVLKGDKSSCVRCNYKTKTKNKLTASEKMQKKASVNVVSEKDSEVYPVVDLEEPCKSCGNTKAYFWTMQTRAGDEAETKFFKCVKCQHTWREYR
ncbi:MAG: DNA-directed RNA polymerase subunit M [Candidatus Pacearchaeota archaeon]|nr:MAG: DNA-directed RNA polymerase subunit M [Candidatus Pacearchaeota archaeon]